ncbi:MFS transporter [Nocardia panacis]|uniref:MFS transporter n=1 Tax=Nocardia panacis TaxID=2340916 RepID=A0A3A4K5G6_9NOCA|nr:MFS transporter [Nocardia panacis]RJO72305.1 MFS transporter [Nocardia panacis]
MSAVTLDRPTRIARVAVFTVFTLNGFLLSMWVVHIPVITDRTGVDPAALGMFILLMAGAGIVGMRAAGPLADRFGSRAMVGVAAAVASLAVLGPGLAVGPLTLAIALACFGFGNGALDVSMNTQAVHVERAYGRPIMAAFHALFSGGGLLGSLIGAATLRAGWDARLTLSIAAVLGVLITASLVPGLLRDRGTADPESGSAAARSEQPTGDKRTTARKVLALAAIAFGVLLAEGVANDWSTLHMRDHLNADASTAALAFGAFSFTMTAGRLATDRISGRFGRVAVVRYGSALAALGFAVVIASPVVALTLLGWAMAGFGLSGVVPQIFTAAGNLGSATAATDMSRVFGLGYFGLLAGPAVIGWLTILIPLNAALVVPLLAVLLCCRYAAVVAAR